MDDANQTHLGEGNSNRFRHMDSIEHMTVEQADANLADFENIEETKYKIYNICCCKIARIIPVNIFVYKYWIISPVMPLFASVLMTYSIFFYFFRTFPRLSYIRGIVMSILVSFSYIMFMICYYLTMCSDPGYLPYDWIKTKKTKYAWEELLPGTAIRDDQVTFAKSSQLEFAYFSRQSGKFVVRGDHICSFVTNWIGKRNHKYFQLMLFYGSFYTLLVPVLFFTVYKKKEKTVYDIVQFCNSALELLFFCFMITFLFDDCFRLLAGKTQLNMDYDSINLRLSNVRDIYGHGSICFFCCPTQAFGAEIELL